MAYNWDYILRKGLKALDALVNGEPADKLDMLELAEVERFLGLDEPGPGGKKRKRLAEMAPRTRRRYVAAAKKGDYHARNTLKREQQMRKHKTVNDYGVAPRDYTILRKLVNEIENSGVDIGEYLSQQTIKDMIETYGFAYMVKVLTQQVDSIREYTKGNAGPGNQRWHSRGQLEEEARKRMQNSFPAVLHINGTDPYYYYHGTLR